MADSTITDLTAVTAIAGTEPLAIDQTTTKKATIAQLITALTEESSIADDDYLSVYDTDAGAIRKVSKANLLSALQTAVDLNTTHRSSDGTDHANVVLNDTHRSSDGSDHTFIDQDVTDGSSPTLDATNITGFPVDDSTLEETISGAGVISGYQDLSVAEADIYKDTSGWGLTSITTTAVNQGTVTDDSLGTTIVAEENKGEFQVGVNANSGAVTISDGPYYVTSTINSYDGNVNMQGTVSSANFSLQGSVNLSGGGTEYIWKADWVTATHGNFSGINMDNSLTHTIRFWSENPATAPTTVGTATLLVKDLGVTNAKLESALQTKMGYVDQDVTSGSAPTFTADNLSDGGSNAIITTTQETNFEAAYSHVSADGSSHTYIDQDVTSGSAPTFTADNLSDGGSNAIITTTQETNFETAYTHSSSDGTDHADVVSNNTHRTSEPEKHRLINDSGTSTTELFSASKINSEIAGVSAARRIKVDVETSTAGLGNITLSGEQTLNGLTTASSRIIVVDQTDATENGIYDTASGAWSRATDYDGTPSGEIGNGDTIRVNAAASTKNKFEYVLTAQDPVSVGVTELTYNEYTFYQFGTTSGTAAEGNDARIPTQDENDALTGTSGTPSSSNKYVTNDDSRNTDSRTPVIHDVGGVEHSSSTLSDFNNKISDATLIDTTDSRLAVADDSTLEGTYLVADAGTYAIDASVTKTNLVSDSSGWNWTGVNNDVGSGSVSDDSLGTIYTSVDSGANEILSIDDSSLTAVAAGPYYLTSSKPLSYFDIFNINSTGTNPTPAQVGTIDIDGIGTEYIIKFTWINGNFNSINTQKNLDTTDYYFRIWNDNPLLSTQTIREKDGGTTNAKLESALQTKMGYIDQDVKSGTSPTFNGVNISGIIAGDVDQVHVAVRKGSVGTIAQARPVYITGYNVGGWYEVEEADNSDPAKMPAIGIAEASITNAADTFVAISGRLTGLDTSSYSVGDELFVDAAAVLTATKPTGSGNSIQKIAQVARSNVSNGVLIVFGAGRSNDVPNIASNNFWLGDGSGVATATNFDTEVSANSDVVANTAKVTNATHTGDVTGDTALTIGNDKVTYAKMQNVAADDRILGNVSGADSIVAELTAAQVYTMIKGQIPAEIGMAVGSETADLTTGTAKLTFRMPYAMTLTSVRASVNTAPTGSVLTVDINESGTTILSTKLTIDAGEKTSETAATPPVISDSALADDAEITIDIDTVGSTVAGKGLKVWLIGTRT